MDTRMKNAGPRITEGSVETTTTGATEGEMDATDSNRTEDIMQIALVQLTHLSSSLHTDQTQTVIFQTE